MPKLLPVVSCSRRTVLEALGVAALAGWILDGCGPGGANLPNASSTTCGANLCIDLTDPANADLVDVGGAMAIDTAGDTVLIARTSPTEVIALSAVCTHSGCIVDYNASSQKVECNCHGSLFSTTGQVLRGPANAPLKMYAASLAGTTITITA
jgi:cytochrome b6-f complex iron-sulfur subunit